VTVQKADTADLQEILDLQLLAYQSEALLLNNFLIPPLTQTLAELEAEFSSGIFLKATDEKNTIIGSVRGYSDKGTLYVGKLIVHPDRQGKGIGTLLLHQIESEWPHSRYELFTSSKSIRNINLYEQVGYRPFTEKSLSGDLTFIYLEKIV